MKQTLSWICVFSLVFNVIQCLPPKNKKKTKTKQKGNQLGPPQDSPRTVIFYSTGLFIHIHTDFMFIPTRSILQINLLIEYWCFYSKNYHIVLVRKLWVTLIVSLGQEVCQNQKVCDREWEASEVVEATLESESLRPICVQIDIFSFLFPFFWELYFKGLNIGCFMRTLYRE